MPGCSAMPRIVEGETMARFDELGFYTLAGAPASTRALVDEVRDGEAGGERIACMNAFWSSPSRCARATKSGSGFGLLDHSSWCSKSRSCISQYLPCSPAASTARDAAIQSSPPWRTPPRAFARTPPADHATPPALRPAPCAAEASG